jgi:hypothetical protein
VPRQQLHGVHDSRQAPPLALWHCLQAFGNSFLSWKACVPDAYQGMLTMFHCHIMDAHLPPAGGGQDVVQQVGGDLAPQEGRQLLKQLALMDLSLRHPGMQMQSRATRQQPISR